MKLFYHSACFLILFSFISIKIFSQHALTASLGVSENSDANTIKPNWIEVVEERTPYSSTYKTNDGQIMMTYSQRPINYYNSFGNLVPVDFNLKPLGNGKWAALDQPNPTILYGDASACLTIGKNESDLLRLGLNCKVNGQKSTPNFTFKGNTILCSNVVSGVDKEFVFTENAVKYNYIVKQPQTIVGNSYVISEELEMPEGYKIQPNKELGKDENGGWVGELNVLNTRDEVVSTFMAALCFDGAKNYTVASYHIKNEGGKTILEMRIPKQWMNDASRVYPIVIDPQVVGPLAQWTGGAMPSCMSPVYNKDSILVTIPGGITVTGLFITSSYYADPFTAAVMSQGSMYFSTVCGQSQTFTVPNANTPGTAYLDSFNIYTPLTCCFPKSCSTQTFYLRMHLARTALGVGCNTTYIRYNQFTQWPFKAQIIGRTPETFGNVWTVPTAPICSNKCTFTATVSVRYGVQPYTVTHPWLTGSVTQGNAPGCSSGASNIQLTLTIPGCPTYCNGPLTISVPSPTVVDACGSQVTGFPSRSINIKRAPDVNSNPDSITICSGDSFLINLSSCIVNDTINWYGNSITGTANINDIGLNTTTSPIVVNYSAYAQSQGCYSDTIIIPVTVDPLPDANYSFLPTTSIANVPVNFSDISSIYAGNATSWSWTFGDNTPSSTQQNPTHTYTQPGTYTVCLYVTTNHGCLDSTCREITVIPAEIITPNVFTPNGDGKNDLLTFGYLEFYENNKLEIFNRWGELLYTKQGYKNDWDGKPYSDGTYFYILSVPEINKLYKGYVQLLR